MGKIFILIWVHRGLIQEPEIFQEIENAKIRINEIKKSIFNPDYDELELFEKTFINHKLISI